MKPNRMNSITRRVRTGACRLPLLLAIAGIAIGFSSYAPTGLAGILQLGEPFNYSDGSLDSRGTSDTFGDFSNWGQNFEFDGSQWTSDWAINAGSNLDLKTVSNALTLDPIEAVGPDAQGNYSASLSRGFTLGKTSDKWTFAATFTTTGDPSDDYISTVGFGDAASIGIKDGQFVAQLGSPQFISSGQVLPNTPYTILAEVEFGVPVDVGLTTLTGERISVWVNESYRAINEGTAAPLIKVESAAEIMSLGNTISVNARTSADAAGDYTIMSWDDVFIGHNYQDVNGFRHDVSPDGANVQEGYFSWDTTVDGLSKTYLDADTGYGDVTMTIGGNNVVVLDGGSVGTVADDLLRDGVKGTSELTLRLEGLDAGNPPEGDPYVIKTYHNDPASLSGPIEV